jgi:putative sigma-54 modulation protein
MRVSYKGIKQELPARIQAKLDAKFAKLSKLLEKRGELEAHVVVTVVRHLNKAEVTIPFYDHQLLGIGSDADLFTALSEALDKLETQAVKNRGKWQERRRDGSAKSAEAPVKGAAAQSDNGKTDTGKAKKAKNNKAKIGAAVRSGSPVNVFRVNHHDSRKPMTLDEAILEMEQNQDYVVYRDAEKERVSVLVRRRDGHFDLIEG